MSLLCAFAVICGLSSFVCLVCVLVNVKLFTEIVKHKILGGK